MAKRVLSWGAISASLIVILTACGGGGGGDGSTPPPDTRAPVVTAARAEIATGASVDLFVSGAVNIPKESFIVAVIDEVTQGCPTTAPVTGVFGDIAGAYTCVPNATGGSVWKLESTVPFTNGAKVTLTLTPKDAAGNQGSFSTAFTIVPAPLATVTLTATPDTLTAGQSATLAWTTENAVSCLASGGWTGSVAATGGSQTVTPTATTTYGIECRNSANVSTGVVNVNVTVTPAPVKLEYHDVVIAIRVGVVGVPNNLFGVDRTVPGVYTPIKTALPPFYSVGIRMPRADNCLVEVTALDNATFVERKLLLNPKTLEVTLDTSGRQDALVRFRNGDFRQGDYRQFNDLDPILYPEWYAMARVAAGTYYTRGDDGSIDLWFQDNAGVDTRLFNGNFDIDGVVFSLWSLSCQAK